MLTLLTSPDGRERLLQILLIWVWETIFSLCLLITKAKLKNIWSVIQLNKCLVLFVEGQTEVEFYKTLIKYIRECHADKKLG